MQTFEDIEFLKQNEPTVTFTKDALRKLVYDFAFAKIPIVTKEFKKMLGGDGHELYAQIQINNKMIQLQIDTNDANLLQKMDWEDKKNLMIEMAIKKYKDELIHE